MTRARLPNRRPAETFDLEAGGLHYTATMSARATAQSCAASRCNSAPTLKPSARRCVATFVDARPAR